MRKLVVAGEEFQWRVDNDWGLSVYIVGDRGRLRAGFPPRALVTPHAVRTAIERAIAEGWTTGNHVVTMSEVDDRAVRMPAAPSLSDEECALLDAGDLAVYADWLLERGDPQGELIAHGDAALQRVVLGPVADVTRWQRWEHGLFVGAGLYRYKNGVVDAAVGHRAWRTVRELDARESTMSTGDAARIITHPVMRSLQRLTASVALVRALRGVSLPKLTHLAIDGSAELELDAPLEVVYAPTLIDSSHPTRISRTARVLERDGGVFAPFWQAWDRPGPTASRQDGILTLAWDGPDHPHIRDRFLEGISDCDLPRVFDRDVAPFRDAGYATALDAVQ